jgi:hypothetical protein
MQSLLRRLCWLALLSPGGTAFAEPLGQEFTYQGQLNFNGSPVNGPTHLRFSVWDDPAAGSRWGLYMIRPDVPVTNGLFKVELTVLLIDNPPFPYPDTFAGDKRWLQIEVCADAQCGTTTVLSPRQPITPVPYAQYAMRTGNLYFSQGNVGIDTATPFSKLEIAAQDGLKIRGFQPFLTLMDTNSNGKRSLFSTGNGDAGIYTESTIGSSPALIIKDVTGNVGVGVPSPAAKLHVSGNVKLGSAGQYFAHSGEENMRVMRGVVDINGGAPDGCCFSSNRSSTGVYNITFTVPFGGTPVVMVTPAGLEHNANISAPTNSAVQVRTDYDGTLANCAFHFIAIGPP